MNLPSNVRIEYQRDASIKGTELLLINKDSEGVDHGALLYLFDDGRIALRRDAYEEGSEPQLRFVFIDQVLE